MNRNTESHFSYLPTGKFNRSKFHLEHIHKTSFNMADLVPIYFDMSITAGDTHSVKQASVIRMQTPKFPIMDNIYMDIYYFYVPYRILWNHFKDFMGENTTGPFYSTTEYTIPKMNSGSGVQAKTFFDYIGVPTGIANTEFSDLPIRAYVMIYNEWFRDQNLIAPYIIRNGDTAPNYDSTSTDPSINGKLLKIAKAHDYFTSALPEPQKGPAQTISLGTVAPVIGNGMTIGLTDGTNNVGLWNITSSPARLSATDNQYGTNAGSVTTQGNFATNNAGLGLTTDSTKSGLIADLTNATAATINAMRWDFAIQRVLEKDARGGTRYREIMKNHFGVNTGDARVQIPEYLGGKRIPININQVLQNTPTSTTPLGQTGAYSCTADADFMFTKSFVEPGMIFGIGAVRQTHTYQQGLNRFLSKSRRFDWYLPTLAYLGEQAILNSELYCQGLSVINSQSNVAYDLETFGFQERWAEYRYMPSRVSAEMRSNYATSLDSWHLADNYANMPILGQQFIEETDTYLKRAIVFQNIDQFWADFYFENEKVSEMPVYSIPGLIDHF